MGYPGNRLLGYEIRAKVGQFGNEKEIGVCPSMEYVAVVEVVEKLVSCAPNHVRDVPMRVVFSK